MPPAPAVRAVPLLLAALLIAFSALAGTARGARLRTRTAEATEQRALLRDLNAIRARHGLSPLRLSPELDAAAQQHALEMLSRGYFSHSSADGAAYWQRIRDYYPVLGDNWSVGENLLWWPGDVAAARAVSLWMGSPEHRANILRPSWQQVGIAIDSRPDAPGVFRDLNVTIFTTDFGARTP